MNGMFVQLTGRLMMIDDGVNRDVFAERVSARTWLAVHHDEGVVLVPR